MNISSVLTINQYNATSKSKTKEYVEPKSKIEERIDIVELSGNKISADKLEKYKDGSFLNDPSYDSQFEKFINTLF